MTRSAVLTCFPSFAFFTPHSPRLLLFLSLTAFFSPIYPSLFQLFHTVLLPLCITPCVSFASILIHACFSPPPCCLLPSLFSSQRRVGSRDRDDFISRGTNHCRVISLQDRRDNSSGLVMHSHRMDRHTHTEKARKIFSFSQLRDQGHSRHHALSYWCHRG